MKKLLFFIVLWVILNVCANAQEITLQHVMDKGVMFYPIGNDEIIMTIRTQEEADTFWFLLNAYGNKKLGTNLSSLIEVVHLLSSPDGKYLAVLSVGEGHPILEVVNLEKLRTEYVYQVLHEINPYPGVINIDHWEGSTLILESDIPLHLKKEDRETNPDPLLPSPQLFLLNITTGTITTDNSSH